MQLGCKHPKSTKQRRRPSPAIGYSPAIGKGTGNLVLPAGHNERKTLALGRQATEAESSQGHRYSIQGETLEMSPPRGIDQKLVHLADAAIAALRPALLVVVFRVLVVDVAILPTLFLNHTHTIHVVVMGHHRGQQDTHCGHPQTEHV